jgi:hypothetical protein
MKTKSTENESNVGTNTAKDALTLLQAVKSYEKARREMMESINMLAKQLSMLVQASGRTTGQPISLPRGFSFVCWPSGEYILANEWKPLIPRIMLDKASPESVSYLAEQIQTGWLDEVAKLFEKEADTLTKTAKQVKEMVQSMEQLNK